MRTIHALLAIAARKDVEYNSRIMANLNAKTERAVSYSMTEAARAQDLTELPIAIRTVAIVHAAQGVIDNGGFQYFFESDFPQKPPYSIFADAYRTIGADEAATILDKAISLFPFDNPHLHVAKRNQFMDAFNDEDDEPANSPFEELTHTLCGNKDVWRCLDAYVERNSVAFNLSNRS